MRVGECSIVLTAESGAGCYCIFIDTGEESKLGN